MQEGRRAEGGSTITQQLARQSFLSRDKTYRRKLKEVILAAHIEGVYDKNEILEPLSEQGVFRRRPVRRRGRLARILRQAGRGSGRRRSGAARRADPVAIELRADGQPRSRRRAPQRRADGDDVVRAPSTPRPPKRRSKSKVKLDNGLEIRETYGLYFKEQVRKDLVDRFGWERVYQGGLKVYTTMDSELQQAAEKLVEKRPRRDRVAVRVQAPRPQGVQRPRKDESPAYLQGSLVSMDPSTGHVVAMVGGRDFTESRFNRATQAKRQSGSAFKPFVFAAALEAGFSPATVITGLDDPIETLQGKWVPEDEHSTRHLDDDEDGAEDVEQSRRRADAEHRRHRQDRRLRARS